MFHMQFTVEQMRQSCFVYATPCTKQRARHAVQLKEVFCFYSWLIAAIFLP